METFVPATSRHTRIGIAAGLSNWLSLALILSSCVLGLIAPAGFTAGIVADDDLAGGGQATPVESITLPAGFRAQLLRSAGSGEGSWISMTFDDRGRLIVGRDRRGIARMTLSQDHASVDSYEVLEDSLLHCRGVLWAHDSLYVCATDSKGFYRLRDTDADDRLDSVELLKSMDYQSRYGHGTNQIILGPDDNLYLINGNDVAFPEGIAVDSPYRDPQDDHLLPEPRDAVENVWVGHVLKIDPQGKRWEVMAGGFRNPFDLAFNEAGELFTYDADMEWDVGQPWYRPTRLNHVVSGGEYGWRWGTGKWPEYFADSLPTTLDTGLSSPTGMEFGTRGDFPAPYRQSLFMGDWQHGRILQVSLTPQGASYTGQYNVFLEGGALNVCDLTFGPDGALYFITGGRGSQSGLYRVSYTGQRNATAHTLPTGSQSEPDQVADDAATARQLRKRLEEFHQRQDAAAIEIAWPQLNSQDRWLRFAARLAIERQVPELWRERALAEQSPRASIAALLALARVGNPADQTDLLQALDRLPLEELESEQVLDALRLWQLSFIRQGAPSAAQRTGAIAKLDPLYPHSSSFVNRELCRLLIYLQAPTVVPRTVELIRTAISQEDAIFFSQHLARVTQGWTPATREAFFDGLLAARSYQGGHLLGDVLLHIREDAVATLNDAERQYLQERLEQLSSPSRATAAVPQAPFVKSWTWDEIETALPEARHGRSWEQGRTALAKASCMTCHRIGEQGSTIGPDLSHVGSRFDERALLESVMVPSKEIDEKYRLSRYLLSDGTIVTGRPVSVAANELTIQTNSLPNESVPIKRSEIEQTSQADVSPMPADLMNVLTLDEILDLIAYLKANGDPRADVYR